MTVKGKYGGRKVREGTVVSDKMQKTLLVSVEEHYRHPLYKKRVRRQRRFMAHDEREEGKLGDRVRILEAAPISRRKRWLLVEILEKAELPEVAAESIDLDLIGEVKREEDETEAEAAATAPAAAAVEESPAEEPAVEPSAEEPAVEPSAEEAAVEPPAEEPVATADETEEISVEEVAEEPKAEDFDEVAEAAPEEVAQAGGDDAEEPPPDTAEPEPEPKGEEAKE
jgi:small subunit ribosomal protein S17